MSNIKTKDIYLDFTSKDMVTIQCTQYDVNSRTYNIHLLDSGKVFNINPSDYSLLFKMNKKDNTKILNECTINTDGSATYTLTEQSCLFDGIFDIQFMLIDTDNQTIIHTMPAKLNVTKTVADNVDIESSDEFNALNNLLASNKKLNELLEANEQLRKENEEERTANENNRKISETNRQNAEIERDDAESVRVSNENVRISNENIRQSNETVRQSQEADRETNTSNAIINADTATKRANDATDDLENKLISHHFVLTEDKGIANGVPNLDGNVKVPITELYEATTLSKGITQLTDSVESTSTTTAATPNSVKTVNDGLMAEKERANAAENNLNTKKQILIIQY